MRKSFQLFPLFLILFFNTMQAQARDASDRDYANYASYPEYHRNSTDNSDNDSKEKYQLVRKEYGNGNQLVKAVKVGGNDNALAPRQREDFYDGVDCDFVESADPDAKLMKEINAFPVRNCGGQKGPGAFVCSGTVHCTKKIKLGGIEQTMSFYVEGVMCASTGERKCQRATECLRDGGSMDLLEEELKEGSTDHFWMGVSTPLKSSSGE